jgi:type I restriction enzyme S subunit
MDLERPTHWATAKLGELAVLTLGGDWGKDTDFESAEYSLAYCIRGAEFRNWDADRGSTASPRMIKNSSLLNRTLLEGDILVEISGGGPEQPVGRTVLIDRTALGRAPSIPKICTNFLRLLRPTQEIASSYLNCYLTFFYRSGEIRNYQAGSNNLRNLKFNDYLELEIPVPPFAEQHRIIAKIEELFSELDQGVGILKTAREQLQIYRQSLLKNAFAGKLTAAWRATHPEQLETAAALQQRIARERTKRHRQQLADWEADGQQGPKPKPPKPLPPLTPEELAELPELPAGWGWVKLGALASQITDGEHFRPPTTEQGIPFLSAKDVRDEGVSFNSPLYIKLETAEKAWARCRPERNDILIVSRGATVGRMCAVNTDRPFSLLGSVILIKGTSAAFSAYLLSALKETLKNDPISLFSPVESAFLTSQPVLTGFWAHFGHSGWLQWSSTPLVGVVTPQTASKACLAMIRLAKAKSTSCWAPFFLRPL